jgi:hypothetical protein
MKVCYRYDIQHAMELEECMKFYLDNLKGRNHLET